ncbi:MAG TPA: DNA-binding response regulator [Microbacterium sp.]|nr:DNA-binding response regulator [Microbacterium sp.]HBR88592.1 DNA-binding response regulator [Microbacterium sp.]|tara:strand:- start:1514 stop:2158 length:645 start_codon:yes stop_codon:yes gene_type:complete
MTAQLRVFVIDDHQMVRRGLESFLSLVPDFEWVGDAPDAESGIARISELADAGRAPDVVLVDLMLPGMDGAEAAAWLSSAYPDVRSIVLTGFDSADRVPAIVARGGSGFLLKDAAPAEVEAAVRAAARNEFYLDPAVARRVAQRTPEQSKVERLSARERQILELLGVGLSNQDIARRLHISERTARTHVSSVLMKLGVESRTQAALIAARAGLA